MQLLDRRHYILLSATLLPPWIANASQPLVHTKGLNLATAGPPYRVLLAVVHTLSLLQVISPRNHMVFTPLLASTTVGTLEARSVTLHITSIQSALHQPQNQYVQVSSNTGNKACIVCCGTTDVQQLETSSRQCSLSYIHSRMQQAAVAANLPASTC